MRIRLLDNHRLRNPDRCAHTWIPVSIEPTHEVRGNNGQWYPAQGPDIEQARVHVVCVRCATWTYLNTAWAGWQLEGSMTRKPGRFEHHELRDEWAERARAEQALYEQENPSRIRTFRREFAAALNDLVAALRRPSLWLITGSVAAIALWILAMTVLLPNN
jgi:hypothetical protein